MKYVIVKALLIFFYYSSLVSKNCEELFWEAKNQYINGNYQEALTSYQSIEPKSWAVWYNIGVCLHTLQQPLHALVAFKKAYEYGGERDPLVSQALKKSEAELSVPPVTLSWLEYAQNVAKRYSVVVWQVFFLWWWWLLFIVWWWSYRRVAYSVSIIAALSLGFLGITVYKPASKAVIMHTQTVHAGTDSHFSVLKTLEAGTYVTLQASENSWSKICYNKVQGWVPTESLQQI